MLERGASLAFYALFSLIPVLLIAAALFRLLGDPDAIAEVQQTAADAGASESVRDVLAEMLDKALEAAPEEAGSLGLIGLLTLLYGASKIFTDAGRALDRMRGSGRATRPVLKRITDLGWTVLLVVCGLALAVLVFLTGNLVEDLLDLVGLEHVGDTLWDVARWPIALALALLAYDLVTWAGPTGARRPFKLVTPGGLVTVGLWLLATVGYTIYLGNFSRYNVTYGTFAALIILMLWIWYTCIAFLYGAELDQVVESRRESAEGDGPAVYELTVLTPELRGEAQLRELVDRLESIGVEAQDVRRRPDG